MIRNRRPTGSAEVICPLIVRDATAVGMVLISTLDESSASGVVCRLTSQFADGAASYHRIDAGTDVGETGPRVGFRLGMTVGFNSASDPRATYLSCTLPAVQAGRVGSGIAGYGFLN